MSEDQLVELLQLVHPIRDGGMGKRVRKSSSISALESSVLDGISVFRAEGMAVQPIHEFSVQVIPLFGRGRRKNDGRSRLSLDVERAVLNKHAIYAHLLQSLDIERCQHRAFAEDNHPVFA
jgi:hypothetical protein